MAVYNKYTAAVEPLVEGDNAGTAAWKAALALTVNPADSTFVAGTTDLATSFSTTAPRMYPTLTGTTAATWI